MSWPKQLGKHPEYKPTDEADFGVNERADGGTERRRDGRTDGRTEGKPGAMTTDSILQDHRLTPT